MFAQGDVLFGKAARSLPGPLREAVLAAELDDPVLLRSFPLASLEKLGCVEGGRRADALRKLGVGPAHHIKLDDEVSVDGGFVAAVDDDAPRD